VWRNLGLGYFNSYGDTERAMAAFDRALEANPRDARLLYERDQLWKRLNVPPRQRLDELLHHPDLLQLRDDLVVELATLRNRIDEPEHALAILTSRKFQPWEGGEGLALAQYIRANLLLGKRALAGGNPPAAQRFFLDALHTPENLGEAKHLLVNQSELYYWLGTAYANDAPEKAAAFWERAGSQHGDFQSMSIQPVSEATLWSALALARLDRVAEARAMLESILNYAQELERQEPAVDYFATSLPAMLLFQEDLRKRNRITASFLRAQALFGLGMLREKAGEKVRQKDELIESAQLLRALLADDVHHMAAAELVDLIESKHRAPAAG
jgi:tetratricopeptide (TPR) repeat protein